MYCDQCSFKTKCHESLVNHVGEKHKQCLKCKQTFGLYDDLLTHLQFVHDEEVKCKKCDFKGYPKFKLSFHQMVEHGDCFKCNNEHDDNQHLEIQHKSR